MSLFESPEFEDLEEKTNRIAIIIMVILIVVTVLYFFGRNYLNATPEPVWWLSLEAWLGI